jgi:hypothetical protein
MGCQVNDDEALGALENELRLAAGLIDPVPAPLLQAAVDAYEAYALTGLDAELAELVFDSLTQSAPVRGADPPRLLTFQGRGLTLDVEITADRLVGQLIPPGPAEIEILGPGQGHRATTIAADGLGRFAHESGPAAGPFSLRCRAEGAVVVTEWLTV